jgi:hypothetical protein
MVLSQLASKLRKLRDDEIAQGAKAGCAPVVGMELHGGSDTFYPLSFSVGGVLLDANRCGAFEDEYFNDLRPALIGAESREAAHRVIHFLTNKGFEVSGGEPNADSIERLAIAFEEIQRSIAEAVVAAAEKLPAAEKIAHARRLKWICGELMARQDEEKDTRKFGCSVWGISLIEEAATRAKALGFGVLPVQYDEDHSLDPDKPRYCQPPYPDCKWDGPGIFRRIFLCKTFDPFGGTMQNVATGSMVDITVGGQHYNFDLFGVMDHSDCRALATKHLAAWVRALDGIIVAAGPIAATPINEESPRRNQDSKSVSFPPLPTHATLPDIWSAYPDLSSAAKDRIRVNLNNAAAKEPKIMGTIRGPSGNENWYDAQKVREIVRRETEKHGK